MTPELLFPDHVSPQFGVFLVLCDYPHCCLLLTPLPALLLKAALASVFLPRHLRCPTCSEPWLCALRPRGETALRPSVRLSVRYWGHNGDKQVTVLVLLELVLPNKGKFS